ncbi:MAG: hypothetical protein N2V76_08445 [Methanophagales archaeon]|nr:hypothetical protein [Methanophagales archaeon]
MGEHMPFSGDGVSHFLSDSGGQKVGYERGLQKVFTVQDMIEELHPFLRKIFPIAIAENDRFLIYEPDPSTRRYVFVKEAPAPTPIPKGVRAAFPIEHYENRIVCVVSGEIFDSLEGYATIFHEFMHCHQWETCEPQLKEKLKVAQKAMQEGDHMWEINYPFPYESSEFSQVYSLFLEALSEEDADVILECRRRLRQILKEDEFEYMVWQEWKEGFARFIENRVRNRLGLKENHSGSEKPFHRVSFYEGGARFIAHLSKRRPELLTKIERLFYEMLIAR